MRTPVSITRRDLLWQSTCTIGTLSLTGFLAERPLAAADVETNLSSRPARVRAVINLLMQGGPSQMDTFDPKPRLGKENGKPLPFKIPRLSTDVGTNIVASPFKFAQQGQSGLWVSELFPNLSKQVDQLTVIRSMCHTHSDHITATLYSVTGYERLGRPSLGAWVLYGLGSRSNDLPGFVLLRAQGDNDYFQSGFLPPAYQGIPFNGPTSPVDDLQRLEAVPELQQNKLTLVEKLNRSESNRAGRHPLTDAAEECYQRAVSMQTSVPQVYNFKDESRATLDLYGITEPATELMGTQCLIARRLIERGVRFVQINHGGIGSNGWDQHNSLVKDLRKRCQETDRPIAGLLADLAQRGLLEETLVLWGGEFGRTPNGLDGREHNPFGYTVWLAGGGLRPGMAYGATDEYGFFAIKDKVGVHDLHATILHLLGLDHTRLVYSFGGRRFRLTDVEGEVVKGNLS